MKNKQFILLLALIFSQSIAYGQFKIQKGIWRATLLRDGHELPFGFDIQPNADGKTYRVLAINGAERLAMDTAYVERDSLHIPMKLYDSDVVVSVQNNSMTGVWKKYRSAKEVVTLPFRATFGRFYLFNATNKPANANLTGKWSATFKNVETGKENATVGLFEQQGTKLTGTFLSSTGDYRYLAGDVVGDSLFLACYDGSHAFLFKAKKQEDGTLKGGFWSGISGFQTWTARPNPTASLPDANTLTYLKPGYESVGFSFPDASGKMISLKDPRFENKVTVVQIMGSWCPNCMDESNFLAPWYLKNKNRGVEIVGLSFEKSDKLTESAPKIRRMTDRLKIIYPVLLAGKNDATASKSLPMLNQIMGYPTTIFIDKKGKVRQIHTGFSGPGTGKYYDEFVQEFNQFIDKLCNEK